MTTSLNAMLCAVATALEEKKQLDTVLDAVDWEAAGTTRWEFEDWWRIHKVIDGARRQREAKQRQQQLLRKAALAKLTPEERRALGL